MLERQQLQELQRRKKLQDLNKNKQQNAMNKLYLMHNKQSARTQYGLINNGVPVRDPSQMFMFGDTNLVKRSVFSQAQNQGHPDKPFQGPKSDDNQLQNPNHMKNQSLLLSVKNEMAFTRSSSIYSQHLDMANQNMVLLKSKKRKFPTSERLPWRKEVTGGCPRLHDTSTADLDWAHSVNRLPEKTEVHRKKRLILTTQLMQLLFLPAPNVILSEDATAHCDTVAYYAAKLALGDACSLASSPSGKCMTFKGIGCQDLPKIVQIFVDRSKRLEEEISRLEKEESSILDVKVEFQDSEKFSIISHLAKFHSRPLVTPDTASSGGDSARKYVTASPICGTVPEGHNCLSL